jgi:tetratricopeptide (TPR) repeat protein
MRALTARLVTCLAMLATTARADVIDELGKRILSYEGQAAELEQGLTTPIASGPTGDEVEQRFIQAQVAHGVGNYADATILLYDLVEKQPDGPVYRESVFLLADCLFQKGDNLSSREYFEKIVDDFGETNAHYQEALERLIELSIRLKDTGRIADYLARLDRIPQGTRLASVPYVRGKYLFSIGDYDNALKAFEQIGAASPYYLQSRYYIGTTYLARGELAAATKVYEDIAKIDAKGDKDKTRIIELSQLALGRIHYHLDQPSEAIDHYLMIPRTSELFDEALYEVAWVYVKAKEFDKALRSLELLALANAKSAILPEVKILEGNLRIRRAKTLAEAETGNDSEEYSKAIMLFETTRDAYEQPRLQLERMLTEHDSAQRMFLEATGQAQEALDVSLVVPEVAVEWVRKEPDVARVVSVTSDLSEIRAELDETEALLDRLDRAVNSPSRVAIFPSLADRRGAANALEESVFSVREQLATAERALVLRYATPEDQKEIEAAGARRRELAAKLGAIPNAGDSYEDRVAKAKQEYLDLDKKAQEIEVLINTVEAEIVAIDKYYKDTKATQKLPDADFAQQMGELRQLVAELRVELDTVRQEIAQAADEAGVGDEVATEERALRQQLAEATEAEHKAMQKVVGRMSGGDRKKAERIAGLLVKADAIDATIKRVNGKIDAILDVQLAAVKVTITEERTRIAEYRRQLAAYEAENQVIGAEIVHGSFAVVAKKFYEITVRADVGLLDVAWAQKEQSEDTLDRLRLDRASEKNVLDAEFRDVMHEAAPAAEPEALPLPTPPATTPTTTPASAPASAPGGPR